MHARFAGRRNVRRRLYIRLHAEPEFRHLRSHIIDRGRRANRRPQVDGFLDAQRRESIRLNWQKKDGRTMQAGSRTRASNRSPIVLTPTIIQLPQPQTGRSIDRRDALEDGSHLAAGEGVQHGKECISNVVRGRALINASADDLAQNRCTKKQIVNLECPVRRTKGEDPECAANAGDQ